MTYTQLIEELREEYPEFIAMTNVKHIASKSADAIEALQEENALLEGTLESRGRNIAEMQAENERLKVESTNKNDWLVEQRKWEAHANALQAKLDAMGKVEPIYQYQLGDGSWIDQTKHSYDYNKNHRPTAVLRIVYAVPKALTPLTDEQIMAIGKELGMKCRIGGNPNIDFDYARAIEAAHGIGGTHDQN